MFLLTNIKTRLIVPIFFDCVFTGWLEMNRYRKKGSKKAPEKGPEGSKEDPKHRKRDPRTIGPTERQKHLRKERGLMNSELAKKRREKKARKVRKGRKGRKRAWRQSLSQLLSWQWASERGSWNRSWRGKYSWIPSQSGSDDDCEQKAGSTSSQSGWDDEYESPSGKTSGQSVSVHGKSDNSLSDRGYTDIHKEAEADKLCEFTETRRNGAIQGYVSILAGFKTCSAE